MGCEHVVQWYHNYALAMGVTSYRFVAGRMRQSRISRCYALVLNVFQLAYLPVLYWQTARFINSISWFPHSIPFTAFVLYSVSCAAVTFTIISRGYRDSSLVEVERIVARLKRIQIQRMGNKRIIGRTLLWVFYLKLVTMLYLCLSSLNISFTLPNMQTWSIILNIFFINCGMSMPVVATYRYFLDLWNIASCYKIINYRLENILRKNRLNNYRLDELQILWHQHALLGRCLLRLNKIFGLMNLMARMDYLSFSAINFYWGLLFTISVKTPFRVVFFGTLFLCMRTLDFFLMDIMCDLTTQYQNCAYHIVSEGSWHQELNAFMLYVGTSKLSMWVCGLYKSNLELWFQMFGSIISFWVLLLQFHLLLSEKYSL